MSYHPGFPPMGYPDGYDATEDADGPTCECCGGKREPEYDTVCDTCMARAMVMFGIDYEEEITAHMMSILRDTDDEARIKRGEQKLDFGPEAA